MSHKKKHMLSTYETPTLEPGQVIGKIIDIRGKQVRHSGISHASYHSHAHCLYAG